MTQLESAEKGILTLQMLQVAQDEGIDPASLMRHVASGHAVIPANRMRPRERYHGIGRDLRVKINANIGTSPMNESADAEMEKLSAAVSLGAEAVMDLSIAGDISANRRMILEKSPVMVGTVPVYQCMHDCRGKAADLSGDDIIEAVRRHAEDGVDFATVHCGATLQSTGRASERLMGIVSRGGSFMARWMAAHKKENPLYERFDEIIGIAREYDMTLSLGDAMRPGALADAGDASQMKELETLGELAERARRGGVQVMIEGPGHVPLNMIKEQIEAIDRICGGAPSYILGPLVTDRAPGYDHIAG
ncbi:MAG: phosphomethylpyrimidine synthase ThiC, partial [Spirochaetota bacterium]